MVLFVVAGLVLAMMLACGNAEQLGDLTGCCIDGVCSLERCELQPVVANVQTGLLDSLCSKNRAAHASCDYVSTVVLQFVAFGLEEGDKVALVPNGMCTFGYLDGLFEEYFSDSELDAETGQSRTILRAPWTWGPHSLCVKRTATVFTGTVNIQCPSGWFGASRQDAEAAQSVAATGQNWATVAVWSKTWDATGEDGLKYEDGLTQGEAEGLCEAKKMRLCSADELQRGEARGAVAPSTAGARVWTGTECSVLEFRGGTLEVRNGVLALPPSAACAYADCDASYEGERCWHDGKRKDVCAAGLVRAECPASSDWRLGVVSGGLGGESEPAVAIPDGKVAGVCLNGEPCGTPGAHYTVVDGMGDSESCPGYNASDASAPRDLLGAAQDFLEGRMANHGAIGARCSGLGERVEAAACCRGRLPVCELCPFGLASGEGAVGVEACARCVVLCQFDGEATTCECNPSSQQQPAHAASLAHASFVATATATATATAKATATVNSTVPASTQPSSLLRTVTCVAGIDCPTVEVVAANKALNYTCGGASTEWRIADLSVWQDEPLQLCGNSSSSNSSSSSVSVQLQCPAGSFGQTSSCQECNFGLWSPQGSVGESACAACLRACQTPCGRLTTCSCAAQPATLPLVRADTSVAPNSTVCRCASEGACQGSDGNGDGDGSGDGDSDAVCQVKSASCTRASLDAQSAGPFVWSDVLGATPSARCAQVGLGLAAACCDSDGGHSDGDSDSDSDSDSGERREDYFYLPEHDAMAVPVDEVLLELRGDAVDPDLVVHDDSGRAFRITQRSLDTLADARPRTGDCA